MDRAVILTASLLAVATAGLLLACTSPKGGSPEGSAPPPTQEAVLARTATPTPAEIPYVVQRDVTYCSPGGIAQKFDIFSPASREGKAAPAVIYLHGGAWIQGDKGTGVWLAPLVGRLVQEGYVVAAVNYRLAPAHRWPAQIEDAKCAVRYLRANASILGLDSGKIGVIGVSD